MGLTLAALGAGFVAGRSPWSAPTPTAALPAAQALAVPVQFGNDPRELIPLTPGPGDAPGQGVQPGPGQNPQGSQAPGECTVLLHRDGRFYRMQPGAPGPGGEGQPGQPGGDGEVFPLEPAPAPGGDPFPSLPTPDAPVVPDPELRV